MTSGPPHLAHDAGRKVGAARALPLVMDLRDPWSLVQRLAISMDSPLWYAMARRYERRAVAVASLVVMNTEPAARAMRERYPDAAARIIAVPNGYDDEHLPAVARDPAFVVAYAGTVYLDRDPRPLLEAAAKVVRARGLTPDQFRVEFMGTVEGAPLAALAAEAGIGPYVVHVAPGSRRAALAFMGRASMLVSLYQDSDWAVPAKVYDYMLFDAWLLVLSGRESATAELLADTAAEVVAPRDVDAIATVIDRRFAQRLAGERPQRLACDPRLGRRAQAVVLFDAIAGMAGRA